MEKKKPVRSIDDLDGTEAEETVEFAIDGTCYEVALSSKNAELLRSTLQQWAQFGRRADTRRRHLHRVDPWREYVSGSERVAIQEWCSHNGYNVGSRGPLSFDAVDAFRSAKRSSGD